MAFDGIVIANIVKELNDKLVGGRILKISQPEKDELVLSIKNYDQFKLFISASAALPLIYITESTKPNPMSAPNFCMLLRKHLNSARILKITQPGLERIINIKIEHLDEMGDLCTKYLIIEIMGKHSNIIFCEEDLTIVDSIKRISGFVSSVREVLPGRTYFIPQTAEKLNPLSTNYDEFSEHVFTKPVPVNKAIYTSYTGISPLIANEICFRASIEGDMAAGTVSGDIGLHLFKCMERMMADVKAGQFHPNIVYQEAMSNDTVVPGLVPLEFSSLTLSCYEISNDIASKSLSSISETLELYYASKNAISRIRQKSHDLRRIVASAIERSSKKYDLQLKQLKDTEKRDKYKVYGELLTTYGYQAEQGAKELTVTNYYDGEELTIPLNTQLSPIENAKSYFEKYNKLKRTHEALTTLTIETKEELDHLDSIRTSLDIAVKEEDLTPLKEELTDFGYIKRHYSDKAGKMSKKGKNKPEKKVKITSKPYHYVNADGYHMYVGKNNYQNDELTFHFALGGDWWFHSKGIPGSHIIVKSQGSTLPDRVFEDAGKLAAYYSKGRENDKVEIDYLERKNVKKPSGAKPGFVVYYTNYSMMVNPDISGLTLLNE